MLLPRPPGSLFLGKFSLSLWYITQTTPLSFTKLDPTKEALISRQQEWRGQSVEGLTQVGGWGLKRVEGDSFSEDLERSAEKEKACLKPQERRGLIWVPEQQYPGPMALCSPEN